MVEMSWTLTLPGVGPSQLTICREPLGHVTEHCQRKQMSARVIPLPATASV